MLRAVNKVKPAVLVTRLDRLRGKAMHTIVKTNHHDRHFVYRVDVPAKVLADDFDWLEDDSLDHFIHYRGDWYHLNQFLAVRNPVHGFGDGNVPDWLDKWDGHESDSAWTGTVIKVSDDCETYRIGSFQHVN